MEFGDLFHGNATLPDLIETPREVNPRDVGGPENGVHIPTKQHGHPDEKDEDDTEDETEMLTGLVHNLCAGLNVVKEVGQLNDEAQRTKAMERAMRAVESIAEQAKARAEQMTAESVANTRVVLSVAEQELERAIEEGFVPSNGKLGVKFQRAHPPGSEKHAKYMAAKTPAAKQKFRLDWAKEIVETAYAKKSQQVDSENRIDESTGEYLPFKVIWDREGGDAAAYKALT